jgi:hypothetical protein
MPGSGSHGSAFAARASASASAVIGLSTMLGSFSSGQASPSARILRALTAADTAWGRLPPRFRHRLVEAAIALVRHHLG